MGKTSIRSALLILKEENRYLKIIVRMMMDHHKLTKTIKKCVSSVRITTLNYLKINLKSFVPSLKNTMNLHCWEDSIRKKRLQFLIINSLSASLKSSCAINHALATFLRAVVVKFVGYVGWYPTSWVRIVCFPSLLLSRMILLKILCKWVLKLILRPSKPRVICGKKC